MEDIHFPDISFGIDDISHWSYISALFYLNHQKRNNSVIEKINWFVDSNSFMSLDKIPILTREHHDHNYNVLSEIEGCLVHIYLQNNTGEFKALISTKNSKNIELVRDTLRERFPEVSPSEKHAVTVSFWSLGPNGPHSVSRELVVPEWIDIQDNYPLSISSQVTNIINNPPKDGGKLILWSGEPGTGKTYSIRALSWEWREWCSVNYITDPEVFFGDKATYMIDVLLGYEDENKWRLILLEDTGELLSADAKINTGQGLSRLLNVVDGLIGQGLQIMIMITTNEELGKLHPAVSRPGRCVNNIKFERFSPEESSEWLRNKGMDTYVKYPSTLAELYAILDNRLYTPKPKLMGFGVT